MGRMTKLLRLAAQAEGLRWRRTGRGYAIQAGLAAAAAVIGLILLVMLHIAAFAWLAQGDDQGPVWAAFLVAAMDLMLVALLGWLAAQHSPDPLALQAAQVRDDALQQLRSQAEQTVMIMPLLRGRSTTKPGQG